MAKPPYPGLVIVPPSDRWLMRRRLTRLAFLITALTTCALVIADWLPVSSSNPNCQTALDDGEYPDAREDCAQPDLSSAEALSGEHESMGVEVARGVDQADAGSRITVADSDPHPDASLAHQGDAFAQYRLGRLLAQRGEPHAQESIQWYRKASHGLRRLAEAGNGQAMYVLGVMNAFGRGVARDEEKARRWLMQAVAHQVEAARPVLARLEKHQDAKQRAAKATDADLREAKPTDDVVNQRDADPRAAKPNKNAEPSLQASAPVQRVRHEN